MWKDGGQQGETGHMILAQVSDAGKQIGWYLGTLQVTTPGSYDKLRRNIITNPRINTSSNSRTDLKGHCLYVVVDHKSRHLPAFY